MNLIAQSQKNTYLFFSTLVENAYKTNNIEFLQSLFPNWIDVSDPIELVKSLSDSNNIIDLEYQTIRSLAFILAAVHGIEIEE